MMRTNYSVYIVILSICFLLAGRVSARGSDAGFQSLLRSINGGYLTIDFPEDLQDEKGRIVKQPVHVEFHYMLTAELRQSRIDQLRKSLSLADAEVDREKISKEISRVRTMESAIVMTTVVKPGSKTQVSLPVGTYEIVYIPVNPVGRKPVVQRFSLINFGSPMVRVEVGPQGAIIGGGPSVAELLRRIEELEARVAQQEKLIDQLRTQSKTP